MKKILIFIISTLVFFNSFSQVKIATYTESSGYEVIDIPYVKGDLRYGSLPQLEAWPKSFPSDQSFKNMRGVCLQNINDEPGDEIIFSAKNKIYAYNYAGELLWDKELNGTAIYPPSAGDITGDGNIEIVQVTGGIPNNGHIYVFDKDGNILPGWPVSFNNNWIICAPTLADINGDNKLEIILNERQTNGRLHILKYDGSSFSDNWPVVLDGTPAITPSIPFCPKNREIIDSTIYMASTKSFYAFDFNGNVKDGFPITDPDVGFSYQSPVIYDSNEGVMIVGANHGDKPGFFLLDEYGEYYNNWPIPTADNSWTYSSPMVIGFDSENDFFMFGQPGNNGEDDYPALHALNEDAQYFENFPFERICGNEGFITSIYDAEADMVYVFTGSNMKIDGYGKIHAYETNRNFTDFKVMDGFPVEVQGFTFMNGVNLGDLNGDGVLNLVVLSYDLDFEPEDSVHINVFELPDIKYNPEFSFGTYKGSNLRTGYTKPYNLSNIETTNTKLDIDIYPNPVKDLVTIKSRENFDLEVFNIDGKLLLRKITNYNKLKLDLSGFTKGIYFVRVSNNNKTTTTKVIKL